MKNRLIPLFVASLLAFPSLIFAQDTFTSKADWNAAICGTVVSDDLEFGQVDGSLIQIPIVLSTSWGTYDYDTNTTFPTNSAGRLGGDSFVIVESLGAAILTTDASNGTVEGICFGYALDDFDVTINLADGSSVTETAPGVAGDTSRLEFGWVNNTGQDVVSVEIVPATAGTSALLYGFDYSFGDSCDADPTCQDLLADLIDSLYAMLDSADPCDQVWINLAIDELECAQNPLLWETEDRLSDYGCAFFGNNFYATYFLECAQNESLVQPGLIGIQDLLGCVVDNEIEHAKEDPDARGRLIRYAEFFEYYANEFADAECYLQAVLLNFYAWWFAHNA